MGIIYLHVVVFHVCACIFTIYAAHDCMLLWMRSNDASIPWKWSAVDTTTARWKSWWLEPNMSKR